VRSGQLFAGGAGGTARLRQVIELRAAGGARLPAGTRFSLAAWLGGDSASRAAFSVTFRSSRGRVLGRGAIGPAGGRGTGATMAHRTETGALPAGTASATIELTLATSQTNNDGPYAPYAGYDRGVADGLRFSVSAAAVAPVLRAPAARIPRYQHVFLFYFENQDYKSVIGNRRLAPFLNGLLPHASLLANSFAEEHPATAITWHWPAGAHSGSRRLIRWKAIRDTRSGRRISAIWRHPRARPGRPTCRPRTGRATTPCTAGTGTTTCR
jgi:hypothetical protein